MTIPATEERPRSEEAMCEIIHNAYTICPPVLIIDKQCSARVASPVAWPDPFSNHPMFTPASFFCTRTDTLQLNIANRQQCTSVLTRELSKLMSVVQLVLPFCFERTVFLDGSRYAKSGLPPSWYRSTPHSCPAITRSPPHSPSSLGNNRQAPSLHLL